MKKFILVLMLLLLLPSCGYARVRGRVRSFGEIAVSTLIAEVILGTVAWIGYYWKRKNKNEQTSLGPSISEKDSDNSIRTEPSAVSSVAPTVEHTALPADTHSSPDQDNFTHTQDSHSLKLVSVGLASIGRKTNRTNPYFTPERDTERHKAEYTFLHQLAERYTDTETRKILAKHFMLIYILKGEAKLHEAVSKLLTERLTDSLTMAAKVHRKEYMLLFSKAFYEEYMRSHDLGRTLSYTFWSVLAEKHPELSGASDIFGLIAIYKYTHEAVKLEHS